MPVFFETDVSFNYKFVDPNDCFLGESLSKSPDFQSWGQNVVLRAEVPLSSIQEANCQKWPDTEENARRRQFW